MTMRTISRLLAVALLSALVAVSGVPAEEGKGTKVTFDGLSSTAPAKWVKEAPANKMRFVQFKLPKVGDDKEDAELVVFKGFGGSAKQNVERWKGQFDAPAEKDMKTEEMKVGGCEVTYFDVSGTYLDGPPGLPAKSKKKKPGFRMLAVQFEGPDNTYHVLLRGPAKTIEAHKKDFDAWIKGFKK